MPKNKCPIVGTFTLDLYIDLRNPNISVYFLFRGFPYFVYFFITTKRSNRKTAKNFGLFKILVNFFFQGKGCEYYTKDNKSTISSQVALENLGFETPWDIEDLYALGEKHAACPYFAARSLMKEAEIIFCPYNYLIDPSIRPSVRYTLCQSFVKQKDLKNLRYLKFSIADVDRSVGRCGDNRRRT